MATEICCVCSKVAPRPVLICMKCSEGVDKHGIASPTYYCEKSCRERGKKEHERLCKHMNVRKQIYRAGELLQAIFYKFREAAFDMQIKSVVKSRLSSLLVSEEWYTDDRILFRFPHELVPDPKDKARLLTMQACTDGCAYTFELSKVLLQGITNTTIEETVFKGMKGKDRTIRFMPDGRPDLKPYAHSVFAVDVVDGETYVIDPAGAQFDQFKAVVPFEKYLELHAESVNEIHFHGHVLDTMRRTRAGKLAQPDLWDFRPVHIQHEIYQCLLASVKQWEEDNKIDIRQLARGTLSEFEKGKTSLLAKVSNDMTAFVEKWEKDGCPLKPFPRLYLSDVPGGKNNEPACTITPQGEGSLAYRTFKKHRLDGEMPEWLKQFRAGGGTVYTL